MTTNNEVFYFLAGVTVGLVAALLVAPYSGEETRQYLRERVDEGRERAEDLLEKGKEFVGRRGSVSNVLGAGRGDSQETL